MEDQRKKIEEQAKLISAAEKQIKRLQGEMLFTLVGGIGGMGLLLVIAAATSPLPRIVLLVGLALIAASIIWLVHVLRRN